jgi:hypothetical protein
MASLSKTARSFVVGSILGLACESSSNDEDRVDQAPECVAYIQCMQQLVDESTYMALQEAYGPDGPCWANQELADDCTATCMQNLEVQQQMNPGLAECQGGGAGDGSTSG